MQLQLLSALDCARYASDGLSVKTIGSSTSKGRCVHSAISLSVRKRQRTGKSLARIAHSKGIIAVALIHDLLNLRGNTSGLLGALTGRIRDDISFLRELDLVIAHNERMKELLVVWG